MRKPLLSYLFLVFLFLVSCKAQFDPVDYGHDACTYCRMTIIDKRYAAELLTQKGKAYKFDDIACLTKYMAESNLSRDGITLFVANYNRPDGKFIDAKFGVYLHSDFFKSPMNGGYAAFENAENAWALKDRLNTDLLKWENLN